MRDRIEYQSGPTVSQRAPIYIDVNKDPRARSSAYLNLYSSRIGAPVIGVDYTNGTLYGSLGLINSTSPSDLSKDTPNGKDQPTGGNQDTVAPLKVTNLVATSYTSKGIAITFDFDLNDAQNISFTTIQFQVYSPTDSKYLPSGSLGPLQLNKTSSSQSVLITPAMMQLTGLSNFTHFTKIEVATYAGTLTDGWVEANLPTYASNLIKPQITVSSDIGSYSVNITNLTEIFQGGGIDVQVQQYITDDTLAQVQASDTAHTSNWVNSGPATKVSPISFLALDGAHRWIRAFTEGEDGGISEYSDYHDVSPAPVNPPNTEAPNNWASATAAWSGNDILIGWTNPVDKIGASVKVKLVPYVGGVESTTLYAILTHTVATGEFSWLIPYSQIFGQVGDYYSTYKVYISAVSLQGIESVSTITYGPITRTSNLTTAPIITTQSTVDGYYVQYSLGTQGANFGEVYAYYINPTFTDAKLPDYMDLTYSSGGAINTNTFIASSISIENGEFVLPAGKTKNSYIGMEITGNNVPSNTWITNISGSGPYTITLNNNFTGQASGIYRSQGLVYTGVGPANIFSNYYGTIYVVGVLYDNYNNVSPASTIHTVTPINPSQSVINNSVRIGAPNGAIWVGNSGTSSQTTGARIVLGSSQDGTYSGIFAFDAGAIAGSAPTTSIISNDNNGHSYTFETQNARIANWIIKTNSIVNDQYAGSGTYTGLSSNGTYSFWAGANDNIGTDANFSVTPSGQVVAKKITINGDGTGGNLIYAGGGTFTVSQTGVLNATGAKISGELNVTSSSNFNSNINMGSNGIFSAFGLDASGNPATQSVGSSVQIRGYVSGVTTGGLFAYDKNHVLTTGIFAVPVGTTGYTFNTYKALLGTSETDGWIIANNIVRSGNSKITLDAKGDTIGTNVPTIRILASDNNGYGITLAANGLTSNAIAAGLLSNPSFYVKHNGDLYATNATVSGAFTVTGGQLQTDLSTLTTNVSTAQSTATSASSAASTAQSTADSKIKTYYTSAAPTTGLTVGDIWYHVSSQNYLMKRWNGSAWVLASDFVSGNGVTVDPTTRTITQIQAGASLVLKSGGGNPVTLDANGLRLNNGTKDTLFLDASNGNATFSGTVTGGIIQTGATTATRRIVMGESQPDRIDFYPKTGDDADTAGYIWVSDDAGSVTLPGIVIKPPTKSSWASPPKFKMTQTASGGLTELTAVQHTITGSVVFNTYAYHTGNLAIAFSAHRNISAGTTTPSGGNLGDVYIQY